MNFANSRILLLVIWICCSAVPVRSITSESLQLNTQRYNDCGRYACPETGGKYQFSFDNIYTYDYTLTINSTFDNRDEKSDLTLQFRVEFKIRSCDGVMKVKRLKEKQGLDVFNKEEVDKIYEEVGQSLLRFSFYDGSIFNVCPTSGETISSLNIKKGILSAFQNKMKRFDIDRVINEKDVNGLCPTQYNLEKVNGTSLVIRKVKDISNCLERYQLHSIIPTSKYVFQSKFNKWAPLNSSVVCHQTIDHSIPVHIYCSEDHTLKLTNMTYSSRTRITQTLVLAQEIQSTLFDSLYFPDFSSRQDLSFDHTKPKKSETSELEESVMLLKQLCSIATEEFQPDAASTFTKFIHTARHLSYDALELLLEQSSDTCSTGRKHVQDSLPFLRSTAAVSLMKEIMINGNISESTANGWLFAMSLFSRPDEEVIESTTPLLMADNATNNMLLSISSVVHSFCSRVADCNEHEIIIPAILHLERQLNQTVLEGTTNNDKIIILLKSLANAGVQTESIQYTLRNCIFDQSLPVEIRLTAIESHRRLPCDYNMEFLLNIYTNADNEAEIRIAAYLQLMRCPNYGAIKIVKNTLENEEVNQVGSFVWSHLQNVMKSSLNYRIELQSILQDYYLQKKFRSDFRKYSKNFEQSFFLSDYGIGGVISGNIIFSTKTYIPKYLSINVTIGIYGETINALEATVFLQGFEKLSEKFFKDGAQHLVNLFEKNFPSLRFLRSLPNTLKERIRALPNSIIGNFPDPSVSFSFKLFGNEVKYVSFRNKNDINEMFENFDIYKIIKDLLNGKEIKYDYSTVFMDISYVSPTGAGVPLNLDAVGISITNFDTAVYVDASNFSTAHQIFIDGKFKPRFSVNFEGTMGTDLVYEQTQIQLKSKMFTASEVEGSFHMDGYENISLSLKLPLKKFNIFTLESDLFLKNNTIHKDVMLNETAMSFGKPYCFWPLLDQVFGLKICSTYNIPDSTQAFLSFINMLKGPFKFSLYIEKSDPTAVMYKFRYNKKFLRVNESAIDMEFETPNSLIERNFKMLMFTTPEDSNITVSIHCNKTELEAYGVYKNTPNDKVLNFFLNINGEKHVDLILELHSKQDKRVVVYNPKLYFAITSKPVAELTGMYTWTEKKGVSQCDINLQFKTNKFDSNITGYILVGDGSGSSNLHIAYKFQNNKTETLNFDFQYKDKSNKLATTFGSNISLESSFYPEINFALHLGYQKSYDRIESKVDYISNPLSQDERVKCKIQLLFSYFRSFNGLKLNSHLEITKPITDVNVKLGVGYHSHPAGSSSMVLVRYATGKDIVIKLDIVSPQSPRFHYEFTLNTTLPSVQQPMIVHFRINERFEREYDVDFNGMWFSGHTAKARGIFQDKSTHYMNTYIIKLLVNSRLFNEILINAKITFMDTEHKISAAIEHNEIKYNIVARHLVPSEDVYDTFLEYIYNQTARYSMSNRVDLQKKELRAIIHLDKIRQINLVARGTLLKWNSNVGIELQWDVNRDPSQKLIINFNTRSYVLPKDQQYYAKFIFEYPGHTSEASFLYENKDTLSTLTAALEMNPTSLIEVMAYHQNELLTRGIAQVGFQLLTPFENWRESAFTFGTYVENQKFQTNGSLVWQGNQSIVFDTRGGYKFDDNKTSITLSSYLNSTLQDLSALAFGINYTSVVDLVHLSFLLQPNLKYSLQVSTTGYVTHYANATEYNLHLATRTPFLEYVETELNTRLKFMTENRINSDASLRLNDKLYRLYIKGILHPFEKTKLCLHMTTPYEKYEDVSGILFYDPDEKHIFVNLTSLHFNTRVELIYAYNNLSNFHLKLHLATPMGYLSKLVLVAMYNGKAVDLGCAWNSFTLGFAGAANYHSWTDLEYNIQLFTPIESFKESNAIVKTYIKDEQVIVKASISLSNATKAGINLEYNSEQSKVTYLDECDNYYDKDTPGIYKSTVLSNAVFELDTLLYPTIMGQYFIRQSGNRYTLDSKASVFFFKANVWDQLDWESMTSFNNTLRFFSSIDMITTLIATVNMKDNNDEGTNSSMETEIVTFGQKLKMGGDMIYQYQSLDSSVSRQNKTKWHGLHYFIFNLHTPFELLETGKFIITAGIENYVTEINVDVITKSTNTSLHSIVEIYENFFNLNAAFNISSIFISLPSYRLQILRDFSKLQKQIILTLKQPITQSELHEELFALKSVWYLDKRNFISLSGALKTPFHILDELQASLQYHHEMDGLTHHLEAFMKYSNQTEMKARADLKPPNVTLNLESTMEGLKQAHFEGTLERTGAGQQKIDALMITNHNFRIQGSSSVTDIIPFSIKGKLLKGKEGAEVSNVEMYVKKTSGGYNVLAALYSKGKTLNVDTRITDLKDNTRIVNLKIVTARGDTERLEIDAELKLQHPGVYILTVKGESLRNEVKGSSVSKVEIWFRDGIAAFFANSDSTLDLTPISAKAEIFAAWKPPYEVFGSAKVQYSLQKAVTELLNARLYFYRATLLLSDLATGISINFNRKWMMAANLTTIIKSGNDSKIATHLLLPNKNSYSFMYALKYNKQFDQIQHLLMFSRPKDTPCFTLSDVNLVNEDIRGFFAFRCGIRDTLYMVDDFTGKKTWNRVTVRNLMKSNTLSNSLVTNVVYEKRYSTHTVRMKFFYPPSQLQANVDVNFESTENFDAFVNTTTPFQTIPYFACEINTRTDPDFYQRYVKIFMLEKPALFNVTHVKTQKHRSILNDGEVTVKFPVTTWHEGNLIYVYEDMISHINGSAELLYNSDKLFTSIFTKDIRKTSTRDDDYTHLEITNDFMPIGINYYHEESNPHVSRLLHDFKRTEIYNLRNSTSFNLTGEVLVENEDSQEWTTFKILNFNRSIVLKSYSNGADLQDNGIYVKLKPQFWFNYGLRTNKTMTNTTYDKLFDMNIAYPRRNFSLLGNFGYGPNYLGSRFVVFNYMAKPRKAIGIIFNSQKSLNNLRETTTTLFHPSFKKNVTLYTTFSHSRSILADMYADLEYSPDPNRKLVLNGIIRDESYRENRNYKLHLKGKHPATKFYLDVSGILHSETGVHLIGNNISYRRSYLPEHYWIGKAMLNTKQYMIEIERVSLRGKILFYGDYGAVESKHILNTMIVEASAGTDISGRFEVDLEAKETHATINLTSDATDYLKIEGNVPENREAKFNIWRSYNDFNFPQLSFYLALNHSRFLSSALLWRTDMGYNLLRTVRNSISYLWTSAQESIEFWTQFLRSEATDTVLDVWHDAKPEMQEFIEDFNNIKTIQENINYFKTLLNESYHANEFFLKDIHQLYTMLSQEVSIIDKIGALPKIVSEVWESMGETGETIRKSLIWFVNTVKEFYEELMNVLDELVEGKAEIYIAKFIRKATEKFDNFVKDLHISFVSSTESVINELISVLTHYWSKILLIFEPTFIEIIHHIDSTFWSSTRKLVDFIYARKDDFMNSPYILKSTNLTQKLDSIYKDFSKNDFITNVKKYVGVMFDAVYEYYFSQIPFRDELKSIGNEIWEEIKQLYKLQLIAYTVDNVKIMYNQAIWIYEYFDVTSGIQKLIPFIYRQFQENSNTALENEMKVHKPKTKFLFDPESGIIKLEQKLPFPWHAFNETPIYEEIEEYKFLKKVQSYISKSKLKFWSIFNTAISLLDPDSWFPPFKGYAILVGLNNYITFDSRHVPFYGNSCQYLLSHDFIDDEFSLVLNGNREHSFAYESISLLTEGETITINFSPASITLDSRKATSYPLQLNQTYIYFDHNIITVKNKKGITLECNMYYNICMVHLSGWFFGKTSGLLGTMNNEPSDDVTIYNKHAINQDPEWYLWSLSSQSRTCPAINSSMLSPLDNGVNEKCASLFTNTTSPFEACFSEVNPIPFYDICTLHLEDYKVCAAAMAYIQSCKMNSVPIRIPPYCVNCDAEKKIHEGDFVHLDGKKVPQSSDIVFIVEAKPCNKDLLAKKNIQHLISTLNKEAVSNRYTNNQYALVVFGGDGVHDGAHSIILNDKVFANNSTFPKYFENINIGNGNSDIFAAIRFASKLSFRIGVSKTFILIPCSNCDPANMVLDYSVLHHAMIERSIILHILMNETFPSEKRDAGKVLFGLDGFTAYTKEDHKSFRGDHEMRKSIKLTKSLLGYCIPLALESNGTLFAAKYLSENTSMMRKFATVFSKRVVQTMKPNECQECECHSDNNGVPYFECLSCSYPSTVNFDFGVEDEADLESVLSSDTSLTRDEFD
ncbi:uncharacterized protein Apoltp isoform X2 [Planococcus citri]|uniref:uncharacterized protein Apoltp isoform X2 n=1 Tax=Planococcus citri TaxID=170843 RepID=UPI0031F7ADD7